MWLNLQTILPASPPDVQSISHRRLSCGQPGRHLALRPPEIQQLHEFRPAGFRAFSFFLLRGIRGMKTTRDDRTDFHPSGACKNQVVGVMYDAVFPEQQEAFGLQAARHRDLRFHRVVALSICCSEFFHALKSTAGNPGTKIIEGRSLRVAMLSFSQYPIFRV